MAGSRIALDAEGRLKVPATPIVALVPGDDPATVQAACRAIDAVVREAYGDARRVHWLEVDAGAKAMRTLRTPVPDATVQAIRVHRAALVGPLAPVEDDERTLESELQEILDLFLGMAPLECAGTTLLCWENRETSAAGLGLEEGGSDSAHVTAALAEARGRAAPEGLAPGWAVSMTSRHGTERFVEAAMRCGERPGLLPGAAVLHADDVSPDTAFLRRATQVRAGLAPLRLGHALSSLLAGRPLPGLVLSSAAHAAHLLRLAHATARGALAAARTNPETGHAVFGPLRNDLPASLTGPAMLASGELLLRHLGWVEAADALVAAEPVAKAS